MVRISVSTVDSNWSANVTSATSSVERGPIMWTPSSSSYFFSATIFLHEALVSPDILARPKHAKRKHPHSHIETALPRLAFGEPDAADLGVAVSALRDVVVVERTGVHARDALRGDDAFRRRDMRELRMARNAQCDDVTNR